MISSIKIRRVFGSKSGSTNTLEDPVHSLIDLSEGVSSPRTVGNQKESGQSEEQKVRPPPQVPGTIDESHGDSIDILNQRAKNEHRDKKVRFKEVLRDHSSEVSPPVSRHQKNISLANAHLNELEERLRTQRERLKEEQLKLNEERRNRRAREHLSGTEMYSFAGRDVKTPDGDFFFRFAETHLLAIKRLRERKRDQQRELRERAIREEIESWKKTATDLFSFPDRGVGKQLESSESIESQDACKSENSPHEPEVASLDVCDKEVEVALWEIDVTGERQRERDLLMNRVVEKAESEARRLIRAHAPKEKRLPTPSYTPKIKKIQKF